MKPIDYSVVESFIEGVSFSWRPYRHLSTSYTCVDSAMGSFVDTVGTTIPLADEGVRFVHYPANQVRRQFGLDQDIPDDLSFLMESPTSVRPFLRHTTFDFWRQCFSAVTVPGSLREGFCTPAMHGY